MSETGNDYSDVEDLPPLVRRAAKLAERFEFKNSCALAYVPLLRTLAAQVRGGAIAEMGTGVGIGTSWIALATSDDTKIVTIDIDEARTAAVRDMFEARRNITVLRGDALEIASHGPFDLVYCDAGPGKTNDQEETIAMTKPGGLIYLDDLGPTRTDLDWWLESDAVFVSTVWVTPELGAILAVKR